MAALLIIMMMAWVIYDTGDAARDALDVQAAADAATWSQSAVEARAMNMIAFANVGKRVTYGMTSFYQSLWLAYAELLALAAVLTVACWVADVFLFGAITSICEKLTEFTIETGAIMVEEAPDLIVFEADLATNYFKKDVKAFDDYQKYFAGMTKWWSWAEALTRGARNGSLVTVSWPVPKRIGSTSFQTSEVDKLPIKKVTNTVSGYAEMCARVYTEFDIVVHLADYALKNLISRTAIDGTVFDWPRPVMFLITAGLVVVNMPAGCALMAVFFGNDGLPYEMDSFSSQARWQLRASNMAFSYAPNSKRFSESDDRQKYSYLSPDYTSTMPHYTGGGYFAMARSEISYQNGTPDLWHTSWTARMRPVALPGEWSALGDNVTLVKAWRDTMPYMLAASTILGIVNVATGGGDPMGALVSGGKDLIMIDSSLGGLSDENIEGLSK
ncbi:MAG: hypothetical protein R3E66_19735 [bacterium]